MVVLVWKVITYWMTPSTVTGSAVTCGERGEKTGTAEGEG
jgi:hypothetical protein